MYGFVNLHRRIEHATVFDGYIDLIPRHRMVVIINITNMVGVV